MKRNWMGWMLAGLVLSFACGPIRAVAAEGGQIDPEAQKIIGQQMKHMQEREAATFPCSLFPQAEIEALVGNPLEKGSYTFNNVITGDHQYQSVSCDWSAARNGGNEVDLTVSLPKHFASGQVECEPGSDDQKTTGIGDQAWWDYQKFFGMGTLRVCSTKAMVMVKVIVPSKDQALARKIAQTLAEKVLASQ
jgi:hypothetical protein